MGDMSRNTDFLFYSSEPVEPITRSREDKKERKVMELTTLATSLRNTLNSTGLQRWEITLEGYLIGSISFT